MWREGFNTTHVLWILARCPFEGQLLIIDSEESLCYGSGIFPQVSPLLVSFLLDYVLLESMFWKDTALCRVSWFWLPILIRPQYSSSLCPVRKNLGSWDLIHIPWAATNHTWWVSFIFAYNFWPMNISLTFCFCTITKIRWQIAKNRRRLHCHFTCILC